MTDRELMQQALEALEYAADVISCPDDDDSIGIARKSLRERLAQPEQEPVATVQCVNGITIGYLEVMQPVGTKLYTTPPQRKPLTEEELEHLFGRIPTRHTLFTARAIERAHGIREKE